MNMHTAIAPRATLIEMERNRSRALDLYAQAFDILNEARRFAGLAAVSGKTSDTVGGLFAAELSDEAKNVLAPRYARAEKERIAQRERFIATMTTQTDRAMWNHIIQAAELERLMDKTARDTFRDELAANPPPATADNVLSTLRAFMADADMIFMRGIAEAFSGLDRRFKSHDGFKIGSRLILSYAFSLDSSGWRHDTRRDEILRDIERTFAVLDGKPTPSYGQSVVGRVREQQGLTWTLESDYFRLRRFKNGNAHLWFTRPDLLKRVNRLLADYYGEVIGEGSEVADVSDMGPSYHVTPARDFGFFESPAPVVACVFERLGRIEPGMRVLEPSAGRGRLADEARANGGDVVCVELQVGNAAELRAKGHQVHNADFLSLLPDDLGLFDVIVMNPPFDRGRDCDHVRHALKFLKPGGRLVSVMAAGVEFRETARYVAFRAAIDKTRPLYDCRHYRDLPAGSFKESGTMVNTITLALRSQG